MIETKIKIERGNFMVQQLSWDEWYRLASEYYLDNGNLLVPISFSIDGRRLGQWISNQRRAYKGKAAYQIHPDRIKKLEAIGMVWDVKSAKWEEMYVLAKNYYKDNGDLLVPGRYKIGNTKLGYWIQTQRKAYVGHPEYKICAEQIRKLEALGMVWNIHDAQWEEWYLLALFFYQKHGHLIIPRNYQIEGKKIGSWLKNQRSSYKGSGDGRITLSQIKKLDAIGMIWDVNEAMWEEWYVLAKQYFESHQHLQVPRSYEINGKKLGVWIGAQRTAYRGKNHSKITQQQIEKLEAIGMDWDPNNNQWEEMYLLARSFYEEHRHLNINGEYQAEGKKLGAWILTQRQALKGNTNGNLTEERKAKLDSIGMVWEHHEAFWMEMYKLAEDFYQYYGNLLIPMQYEKDGAKLGYWIGNQRKSYKKNNNTLSSEKIKKLENIGMVWDASKVVSQTSYSEQALFFYIKQIFKLAVNRCMEFGFELDIFIPELRLAIEYDGFWHKNKVEKDLEKNKACEKENVNLIRIRESSLPPLNYYAKEFLIKPQDMVELENTISDVLIYISKEFNVPIKPSINLSKDCDAILKQYKFEIEKNWNEWYKLAYMYFQKYGDLLVPYKYVAPNGKCLGTWILHQRAGKNSLVDGGGLTEKQIKMLEEIGMVWNTIENQWNQCFEQAKQFYWKHGHLNIPIKYEVNGLKLGGWISEQRRLYAGHRGSLDLDRKQKLESIGMIWNSFEAKWEEMILLASMYYEEYGDLLIPQRESYLGEKLGRWISDQRRAYKGQRGRLSASQIKRLEGIGMTWEAPKGFAAISRKES